MKTIKIFVAILLLSVFTGSCCKQTIRLCYLKIKFINYDLNEIDSFKIARGNRAYSDIVEIKKITSNSFEIEIDESNYNIYIFDSSSNVIDSITNFETVVTNNPSACYERGDYSYEYKFIYDSVSSDFSNYHEIEIDKNR